MPIIGGKPLHTYAPTHTNTQTAFVSSLLRVCWRRRWRWWRLNSEFHSSFPISTAGPTWSSSLSQALFPFNSTRRVYWLIWRCWTYLAFVLCYFLSTSSTIAPSHIPCKLLWCVLRSLFMQIILLRDDQSRYQPLDASKFLSFLWRSVLYMVQ